MRKQAAEAKPETKDIKAEEQKPKVPAPQWAGVSAGVGEPFRENLETSDPGLSNQPQLYLCKRWYKSALRLLNPIPLLLPSLNLGTDLHLRSIPERERTGQNLDPTP